MEEGFDKKALGENEKQNFIVPAEDIVKKTKEPLNNRQCMPVAGLGEEDTGRLAKHVKICVGEGYGAHEHRNPGRYRKQNTREIRRHNF
jgi:hypothetical protein